MTDRYVDVTLGGTTATYNPLTRLSTGGTSAGYATLAAAITAAVSGSDTIIFRSGTETVGATQTIAKALKFRMYGTEVYERKITVNARLFDVTAVIDFNGGKQQFRPHDNGQTLTSSNGVFQFGSGANGSKVSGLDLLNNWSGAVAENGGSVSNTVTIDRLIIGSRVQKIFIVNSGTFAGTGSAWVMVHAQGFVNASGSITFTLNGLTLIGPVPPTTSGREAFEGQSAAVVYTFNNPVVIGIYPHDVNGTKNIFDAAGGGSSMTMNGGVLHKVCNSLVNGVNGIGQTGVTLNSVERDGLVKFANNPNKAYVSLILKNSTYAYNPPSGANQPNSAYDATINPQGQLEYSILDTLRTQILPNYPNARMTMFMDDWDHEGQEPWWNSLRSFVQAGCGDIESLGISGNDAWTLTFPFRLRYSGTAAVVQIEISDSGKLWKIIVDSVVKATYDCSYENKYAAQGYPWRPEIGVYNVLSGTPNAASVLQQIVADDNGVLFVQGIEVTKNPASGETYGGFDDALAQMIEDGTYTLDTVTYTEFPINFTRRCEAEIGLSRTLASALGIDVRIYCAGGLAAQTAAGDYALANGYYGLLARFDNTSYLQNLSNIIPNDLKIAFQAEARLGSGAANPNDHNEAQVREGVRALASYMLAVGGWWPMTLHHLPHWSGVQIGWIIDEFYNAGVQLVSLRDAVTTLRNTSAPQILSEYVLAEGSAGWGTGAKWWGTGPRPTAINGEPYPDFDIDCGGCQSRTGPFHPVNL